MARSRPGTALAKFGHARQRHSFWCCLNDAVHRPDFKDAMYWLLEQGLASSGLTGDLKQQTYSANILGKLALRMLKEKAESDGLTGHDDGSKTPP